MSASARRQRLRGRVHLGGKALNQPGGFGVAENFSLSSGSNWGNYLGTVVNNSATNSPPTGNVLVMSH